MKIDHVAIYLSDLEKGRMFFEKYFGGKAGPKYRDGNSEFSSYFITFQDGARLELMTNAPLLEKQRIDMQIGYSHIAFGVGSREKVVELTNQLREDGYKILRSPEMTGDDCYESCVADLEGNQIEITV